MGVVADVGLMCEGVISSYFVGGVDAEGDEEGVEDVVVLFDERVILDDELMLRQSLPDLSNATLGGMDKHIRKRQLPQRLLRAPVHPHKALRNEHFRYIFFFKSILRDFLSNSLFTTVTLIVVTKTNHKRRSSAESVLVFMSF